MAVVAGIQAALLEGRLILHDVSDRAAERAAPKPQIYAFVNGGAPGWYSVDALSEDGVFLAAHVCSHPAYGPHDLGVTSDWQHEWYRVYYPDGFEVVWVADAKHDERVMAAYAKHVALGTEAIDRKHAPVAAARKARDEHANHQVERERAS